MKWFIRKSNINAVICGIIVSFFLKQMISKFLVDFKIIDPYCYKLPPADYLREWENIKLIYEILVFPIVSVVTGFIVGSICVTKPWLWGIVAIILQCILPLIPLHIALFPLQSILFPYVNLSFSIRELLLDICLYLFISSSISYLTFQLENRYLNKKAKDNLGPNGK